MGTSMSNLQYPEWGTDTFSTLTWIRGNKHLHLHDSVWTQLRFLDVVSGETLTFVDVQV